MRKKIVILMGSKSDAEHAKRIGKAVQEKSGGSVAVEYRVASAHRAPKKVLEIAREYDAESEKGERIVFIAVAGLSNALSGMLACATSLPVVSCPPSETDLASSLRMPSGVSHAVVLNPENAALYALKILGVDDKELRKKISEELESARKRGEEADAEIKAR